MITLAQACSDSSLFAPWFRRRETWQPWFAFLATLFCEPMSDEQLDIYQRCTGREASPTETQREAWLIIGRRGGKSFILALIAVYLACFHKYQQYLAPGERGTILILAADRKQARV